ncbi:MAG TPA: MogA/MoaB family molybdenum cofactor biosynthesis protein, partial [Microthrixaceae bacterium]|nr:MogA/MoaB family molybdenum cofactor biosynthesis protein [Microthrixaceae bacterium]
RAAVSRESEDAVSDAVRSGVIGAAVAGTHSAGLEADRSEPAGADEPVLSAEVVERRIVADDLEAIVLALTEWCDSGEIDLVLTNGGTGLSPRDVTPEATSQVLDVVAPGIAELMRAVGLRSMPLAALSRQVVGRRRNTIVVNLPGSTRGAVESLEAIASILPHACAVARTEVS